MATGRKRLPDEIHRRRGTLKPSRHGRPDEKVQLEAFVGEPPDTLDDEAKREWFRIAAAIRDAEFVTRVDRALLTTYCALWSEFTRRDPIEGWPAPKYMALRSVSSELGFTPSSRAKIVVPKKKDAGGAFVDL